MADEDFLSILYLAYALPKLRQVSERAAALLEEAILECAVSLSRGQRSGDDQLDLAAFLSHALGDVETITPVGVDLLRQAIGSLKDVEPRRTGPASALH